MKTRRSIHQLHNNHYRWIALTFWFVGALLTWWAFQWQAALEISLRKELVEKSDVSVAQLNEVIAEYDLLHTQGEQTQMMSKELTRRINRVINDMDLGSQSFAVLIDDYGDVLVYPDSRLSGRNISSLNLPQDTLLSTVFRQFPRGQLMTFEHPVTQREQWMVKRYVESLQANLGLVMDAESLQPKQGFLAWYGYLVLFCCVTGGIFFLSSCILLRRPSSMIKRFYIVLSASLLCFLLIVWYHAMEDIPLIEGETMLVDRESVELAWRRTREEGSELLDEIAWPLQLAIQNIDLLDANEIRVSGTVLVEDSQAEVTPLQIKDALQSDWHLQRQIGSDQLWHFVAILTQTIQSQSFPFDKDVLTITLLPNAQQQALLVPMFQHYPSMAPQDLPGLSSSFRDISGWQIERSYFTYHQESVPNRQVLPGLKFKIAIQRSLTGPLISHIMPLCMVSLLNYWMLLLWTKDSKKQSLWGFSTATELQYSASLFFILVISHVALRDSMNVQGVVFIEYFYFVSYFQIIFIAIGSLIYTARVKSILLNQRNVIRLRRWYWPCVFLLCILISMVFLNT